MSRTTWRKVERAQEPPFRWTTLHKICVALGWTPESIDLVLHGGEPVTVQARDAALQAQIDELRAQVAEMRAEQERREAG